MPAWKRLAAAAPATANGLDQTRHHSGGNRLPFRLKLGGISRPMDGTAGAIVWAVFRPKPRRHRDGRTREPSCVGLERGACAWDRLGASPFSGDALPSLAAILNETVQPLRGRFSGARFSMAGGAGP